MIAARRRARVLVAGLELKHELIELGAPLRVHGPDGELVEVAILAVARGGLLGVDADELVAFVLPGEIEYVAVRIMRTEVGERPRRRALDDAGLGKLDARALDHDLDIVDHQAEMVEPP